MKKKIEALLKRLQIAVRHNPAEVVLSVLFCCFGCALYETSWARLAVVVYYFPVLFLITCTLNSMTEGSRWRFAYYLSVLFFIPFFWKEKDFWSVFYWVTLVVVQLLYLVCDWITIGLSGKGFVTFGRCFLPDCWLGLPGCFLSPSIIRSSIFLRYGNMGNGGLWPIRPVSHLQGYCRCCSFCLTGRKRRRKA